MTTEIDLASLPVAIPDWMSIEPHTKDGRDGLVVKMDTDHPTRGKEHRGWFVESTDLSDPMVVSRLESIVHWFKWLLWKAANVPGHPLKGIKVLMPDGTYQAVVPEFNVPAGAYS